MTHLARIAGGSASPVTDTTHDMVARHQGTYRSVFYFTLERSVAGAGFHFPDRVVFNGRFRPMTLDLKQSTEPLIPARLLKQKGLSIVHLDGQISQGLRLSPAAGSVSVHLPEGEGFAQNPVTGTKRVGDVLHLPRKFVADRFALKFSNTKGKLLSVMGKTQTWGALSDKDNGVLVTQNPILPLSEVGVFGANKGMGIHRVDGQAVSEEATTFLRATTIKFEADRIKGNVANFSQQAPRFEGDFKLEVPQALFPATPFSGESYCLIPGKQNLIQYLRVQSNPAAPRMAIARADQLEDENLFWNGDTNSFKAGDSLAKTLNRILADSAPGSDSIQMALVVTSDLPCQIWIDHFELPYQLKLPLFSEKQDLRFDGASVQRHQLAIELPSGDVSGVHLEIDRGLSPRVTKKSVGSKTGLSLRKDRWFGTRLQANRSGRVLGVSLSLELQQVQSLNVELRLDRDGQPRGGLLAQAVTELKPGPEQFNLNFGKTVMLNGVDCWLLVRPAEDAMVWWAKAGSGLSAGFEGADDPTQRHQLELYRDLTTSFHFIQPLEEDASPLAVYLDDEKLQPASIEGRDRYDLDTSLVQVKAGAKIYLESSAPGRVTVYPTDFYLDTL